MSKDRLDLEQEIMDCWNVTKDVNDIFEFVGDDEFFTGMDPKHADKITNLLMGISELYEVKFNKLWNTFEQCLKNGSMYHKPEMMEVPNVNRVEVIDATGRAYTNYRVTSTKVSFQDYGETLKIFVEDSKNEQDVDNEG